MPSDHFSEKIIDRVISALLGINQGAGYYYNIGSVNRYSREEMPREDLPALDVEKAGENKTHRGSDYWACNLRLQVTGIINRADEDGLIKTDRLISNLQDDVELALMRLDWAGIGGGETDVRLERLETTTFNIEIDDNPMDGFAMHVGIYYSHKILDTRAPLAVNLEE